MKAAEATDRGYIAFHDKKLVIISFKYGSSFQEETSDINWERRIWCIFLQFFSFFVYPITKNGDIYYWLTNIKFLSIKFYPTKNLPVYSSD